MEYEIIIPKVNGVRDTQTPPDEASIFSPMEFYIYQQCFQWYKVWMETENVAAQFPVNQSRTNMIGDFFYQISQVVEIQKQIIVTSDTTPPAPPLSYKRWFRAALKPHEKTTWSTLYSSVGSFYERTEKKYFSKGAT